MSINVYIPTPFRHLVGNRTSVKAKGENVSEILFDLDQQFPGFRAPAVRQRTANLAHHINVYVNQVEIEHLQGEMTAVKNGDEVAVIPALAGGAPTVLTPEMVDRYSRHLIMPQVGSVGQRKIIESIVLIIGAGGLGSPVALYLALAGVGKIGIIDFDVVDRSNLQRQILHAEDGHREAESDLGQGDAPRPQPEHRSRHPRRAADQRTTPSRSWASTTWW